MPGITINGVNKVYDNGFQAVHDANLTIADGEFMVLVGPSGCGKTTTLRMIAGLEDITSGDVLIGDRQINDIEPKDRDIAMVFQNYALYPHMTIFENMAYGLKLRRTPKAEIMDRVNKAAVLLGLDSQLTKRPKQLSGGQRQRVALGRAIVRQPSAFLFDEPLSNLDAKLRGEMRFELKTLQQQLKTTAVYVTHDQIEAMTLGDRITVMNQGVIQQVADPTTLYDWPANRFVAGFIGTPPMNFFTGQLDADGQGFTTDQGDRLPLNMQHQHRLAEYRGTQATIGIRPEFLSDLRYTHALLAFTSTSLTNIQSNIQTPSATLRMRVHVVEVLGDHQYVYLAPETGPADSDQDVTIEQRQDNVIIMKNNAHCTAKPGDIIEVGLDTSHAHIFAGTDHNAENITLPPNE